MRILEKDEMPRVSVPFHEAHAIEVREVDAFIDSKAYMAEVDLNPEYSVNSQREHYKKAIRFCCGRRRIDPNDYEVHMSLSKPILMWKKSDFEKMLTGGDSHD